MPTQRRISPTPGLLRFEDLILQLRGPLTWGEFAAKMPIDDRGRHVPGRDRLEQIVQKGILEWPRLLVMQNLAIGGGVSERVVLEAAATSLDFAQGGRDVRVAAALFVAGIETLPDEDLAALNAHARSLVNARQARRR